MFKKKGTVTAANASGSGLANKFNIDEVLKIGADETGGQNNKQGSEHRMREEQAANDLHDEALEQIKEFKNEKKLLQSMTRGLGAKALSTSLPDNLGSVFDISQQRNLNDYGDPEEEVKPVESLNTFPSQLQKRQADDISEDDTGDLVDAKTHKINPDKLAKIERLSRAIKEDAKNKAYWSVGMIEVDIGLDRKIANIEATESLKREYLIQEFVKGLAMNPSLRNGKILSTSKDRVDPIQNVAKWIFKPQGAGLNKKEREKKELHDLVKCFKHEGKGQRAGKVLGGLGIRLGQLPAKLLEEQDED